MNLTATERSEVVAAGYRERSADFRQTGVPAPASYTRDPEVIGP